MSIIKFDVIINQIIEDKVIVVDTNKLFFDLQMLTPDT